MTAANSQEYDKGYRAVRQGHYVQNGTLEIIDGTKPRIPTADELAGMHEALEEMAYVSGRTASPTQRLNAYFSLSQN